MRNMLIVDDDKDIIRLLRLYFEKEDIMIYEAYDGEMAYFILKNYEIDLALVDIMMPRMNGYELIKKVRKTMNLPILVLSAKAGLSDRILGLDLGADDYIAKPFEPLEVVAKVKARMRSIGTKQQPEEEILKVGEIVLNTQSCGLVKETGMIELTKIEYLVLKLFMEHPGRVFTKEQIYQAGWGEEDLADENAVRVIICRIREKTGENCIKSIRGLGYRMEKK